MRHHNKRVLIAGDIHEPWSLPRAKDGFIKLCKDFKPDVVVQIGDGKDFYLFSRFLHDPEANIGKPEDELANARDLCLEFWKRVQKAAPKAKCVQLLGNHDARAMKRIKELAPPYTSIVRKWLTEYLRVPGVQNVESGEIVIDGVKYEHGDNSSGPPGARAMKNLCDTVYGHTHKAGVVHIPKVGAPRGITEMNVGWMGDRSADVFSYYPSRIPETTSVGCGAIDEYGMRFCNL